MIEFAIPEFTFEPLVNVVNDEPLGVGVGLSQDQGVVVGFWTDVYGLGKSDQGEGLNNSHN